MKYILMMNFPIAGWQENQMGTWPPADIQANNDYLIRFNQELAEAGELVENKGLGGPEGLRVVRASDGGGMTVSDGPFPESKEFLAGYIIVDVPDAQRAYAIAARFSALPGRGGRPANLPIEVRPLLDYRREDC